MLFNSYAFLFLFLPLALAGFYAIRGENAARLRLIWLVISSLVFYGWSNPDHLPLLCASILINYFIGKRLTATRDNSPGRGLLTLGVALNLGLLAYVKYTGFLFDTINMMTKAGLPRPDIILPLGVSFFTFQQIAFLVDIRSGKAACGGFMDYLFFVAFFPKLLAGPITRHRDLMPQLNRLGTVDETDIAVGVTYFLIGLAKKVLIADAFASFGIPVYQAAASGTSSVGFAAAWMGSLAYSLQMYFDFSGYSDMAIGLARIFGLRLPVNFDSPYKARSLIDFWTRWHMTLSNFLRDYLYIPIGGNRKGETRRYINIWITMMLGGLWHGANWTFVVWGIFHGVLLWGNHAWRNLMERRRGGAPDPNPRPLWGLFLTFGATAVTRVLFGSPNVATAFSLLGAMFGFGAAGAGPAIAMKAAEVMPWDVAGLIIVWMFPNSQEFMARFDPPLRCKPREFRVKLGNFSTAIAWVPNAGWAIVFIVIAVASVLSMSRPSHFIYFQF